MKLDLSGLSARAALAEVRAKANAPKPKAKPVRRRPAGKPAVVAAKAPATIPSEGSSFGFPAPAPRRHATSVSRVSPKRATKRTPKPVRKPTRRATRTTGS